MPDRKKSHFVNSGVDNYLRLVPFPFLERQEATLRELKVLQIGKNCSVIEEFKRWQKSSPNEALRILEKLKLLMIHENEPKLKTIKRVGKQKRIVELVGNSARLFCFHDQVQEEYLIICVETFWITGGGKKKKKLQNQSIESAERLMERWMQAIPIEGHPHIRVELK